MLLIDGPNLVFRSHYAAPLLQSRGRPTGVLHVGLMMLIGLHRIVDPQRVIFLWDWHRSFRSDIFPEYKKNRKDNGSRQSVYAQMAIFQDILDCIGISQSSVAGYEADDLAASFCEHRCVVNGVKEDIILVSGDKDWFQLLKPGVRQLRGWSGKKYDWWDAGRVEKEYGIGPGRWPMFLALTGDKIDNIPQVRRGLGPITARNILRKGDLKAALTQEERKIFERNLKLTTLRGDVPQAWVCDQVIRRNENWDALSEILLGYELFDVHVKRRMLWEIGGWGRLRDGAVSG